MIISLIVEDVQFHIWKNKYASDVKKRENKEV